MIPLLRPVFILITCIQLAGTNTSFSSTNPAEQRSEAIALAQLGNGIAAIAEGEIVTFEEVRKSLDPMIPKLRLQASNEEEFKTLINDLSKDILQNIIDRILIVKEAENLGIMIPASYIDQEYDSIIQNDFNGNRRQFLSYLDSLGKSADSYREEVRKNLIVNIMRSRQRENLAQVSPEKIEEYYINNKIRFYQPAMIHLKQIILIAENNQTVEETIKQGEVIVEQLSLGQSIQQLANQYGNKQYNRPNGDWGWVRREDLRSELVEIAFQLKAGEYTKPIQIDNAVFILYAEAIKESMIQPISEVRDIIENLLSQTIIKETTDNWLGKLREKAFIRYYL
ncbi:MAG: hypothetical protein CML12_03960 [Puniceicoccaceae bacterium]|nr:hypothetical protein [Puniceicoccaceae bacterium]